MSANYNKEIRNLIESVLFGYGSPVSLSDLVKIFDDSYTKKEILEFLRCLKEDYKDTSIDLIEVSDGWRFQVKSEYADTISKINPYRIPRYSRAVLETLAIIVYKQPVTRGNIEEIRGVSVSSNILKVLENRGWINVVGRKNSPGRPELFGTTSEFLNDLAIKSVDDLPSIDEISQLLDQEGLERNNNERSQNSS